MGEFTLTSPAFNHMGEIPKKYTCQGEEINPPLTISGVSQEAKSLVLIMEDPDAPIGTVTHWILCHLDPGTTNIPEACSLDGAIVGKNTMRKNKYMGPCPPRGKHRYFF
ncbi:MAG: YbhB/YbcL family Raf kinase inhibitor-like protein, partial [Candidatus Thorarchaeota archaeon]